MWLYVIGGLAALIVFILIIAAFQPSTFRYERSATIAAPPAAIYNELINFKTAMRWSPWVEMDPEAAYQFDGPDEGLGASTSWEGKKSGAGKMTIIEARPNEYVRYDMEFYKPMTGTATVDYTLTPEENGTRITWAMYGPVNYMGKLMNLFMNCEKMVGDTTEKGFAKLEQVLARN